MKLRFLSLLLALVPLAIANPDAAGLSALWRERIASLAKPRTVSATFTEHRHTPVKKRPVVVTGTVRIDRSRGLSLSYDQRRAPVVILDDQGLLLRHPDGREQAAPPEAENDLRLLHALFAFDLETLGQSYAIAASESGDGSWQLLFSRLPESEAAYRELVLKGDDARLTSITLAKAHNNKTEILVDAPRLDAGFTDEERARYFR